MFRIVIFVVIIIIVLFFLDSLLLQFYKQVRLKPVTGHLNNTTYLIRIDMGSTMNIEFHSM